MNRVTIIVVAAIVALGSCLGLVRYASGAQDRAVEATKPVSILVANAPIPAGTAFTTAWKDKRIGYAQTLATLVPPTAVTDPAKLDGMVAAADVPVGQTIVSGGFVSPDANVHAGPPTFAADLPAGTVAVSFKAESARAVSDLVRPGDRVNLLVQVPNASVLGLPDSGGAAIVHVFQDLKVIAIGTVPAPAADAAVAPANPGTGLYTVAVAPADSARLLLLANEYDLFVTLVGPKTAPESIPPIADRDGLPATPTGTPVSTPSQP